MSFSVNILARTKFVWLTFVASTTIAFSPSATAVVAFSDLTDRLVSIASCDPRTFPMTKKDTAAMRSFIKQLKDAGVREKDEGLPPENLVMFLLPAPIMVFGLPVRKIENFAPPFVQIDFAVPIKTFAVAITTSTHREFKPDSSGIYHLVAKHRIAVAGKKFPYLEDVGFSGQGNVTSYVCRYDDTNPDAGDA